jgi:hypothetical protein
MIESEMLQASTITLPSSCMQFFYTEDFQNIKERTGCEVDVFEPAAGSGTDEWRVRITGTNAGIDLANQLLDQTLQERMAYQQQEDLSRTLPMQPMEVPPTLPTMVDQSGSVANSVATVLPTMVQAPPTTTMMMTGPSMIMETAPTSMVGVDTTGDGIVDTYVVGADGGSDIMPDQAYDFNAIGQGYDYIAPDQAYDYVADQAYDYIAPDQAYDYVADQAEAVESVSMPTTVLPVPEEYVRMLTQEDIDALEREIGCAIKINEPEPGNDAYNFIIYGTKEQRSECHTQIEELLTRRQSEVMQAGEYIPTTDVLGSDAQMETDMPSDLAPDGLQMQVPDDNVVPCTVLPIPLQYLELLDNLEAIQHATNCQIKVTPPELDDQVYQLTLYGDQQSRDEAHKEIENSINDALDRLGGQADYIDGMGEQ